MLWHSLNNHRSAFSSSSTRPYSFNYALDLVCPPIVFMGPQPQGNAQRPYRSRIMLMCACRMVATRRFPLPGLHSHVGGKFNCCYSSHCMNLKIPPPNHHTNLYTTVIHIFINIPRESSQLKTKSLGAPLDIASCLQSPARIVNLNHKTV